MIISFVLTNCATVQFYNDSELEEKTGIEFYSPKPFLVVEKNPAKDVAVKYSIIYLPDKSRPKFAKMKPGLGTSDLQLTLENGIITSYGITADSKIPETITSVAELISSVASLAGAKASTEVEEGEVAQFGNVAAMEEAAKITRSVIADLTNDLAVPKDFLATSVTTELASFNSELTEIAKMLDVKKTKDIPAIVLLMEASLTKLGEIKVTSESDQAKDFNAKLLVYKKEIERAKNLIQPPQKITPSIVMYEIVIDQVGTRLKLVTTE